MTLLETLRAHTGGLLRIKSELFWYGGRGWDGTPDRICLVLDTVPAGVDGDGSFNPVVGRCRCSANSSAAASADALLLIDGTPQWIWVANEDVELIT